MTIRIEMEKTDFLIESTDAYIDDSSSIAIIYGMNKGIYERMLDKVIGASPYKVVYGEYKGNNNISVILDREVNGIKKIYANGNVIWECSEG